MNYLFDKYYSRLDNVPLDFVRGIADDIRWDARLIGISGARGVGKTTLLLQYLRKNFHIDGSSLYVSLDDIWFSGSRLTDLAGRFVREGGQSLFLDEVHKYPGWSRELKNIYDDHPDLKVVFTGSSLTGLTDAGADQVCGAVNYSIQGLSFREYLNLALGLSLPVLPFGDIFNDQVAVEREILSRIRPLKYLGTYLKSGYYPFFGEVPSLYFIRVEEMINMTLEADLPLLRKVEVTGIRGLKQLLQIIAGSVPFVPNISKLSERTGLNRNTIISYLGYLHEAHIIRNLYSNIKSVTRLQKPGKVYLENTNLLYAFSPGNVNAVNLRETFFVNQLSKAHTVEYSDQGEFIIDGRYLFASGGRLRSSRKVRDLKDRYFVVDDIEYRTNKRIPLWLFGFLY